jgi:hypothetical protein
MSLSPLSVMRRLQRRSLPRSRPGVMLMQSPGIGTATTLPNRRGIARLGGTSSGKAKRGRARWCDTSPVNVRFGSLSRYTPE